METIPIGPSKDIQTIPRGFANQRKTISRHGAITGARF